MRSNNAICYHVLKSIMQRLTNAVVKCTIKFTVNKIYIKYLHKKSRTSQKDEFSLMTPDFTENITTMKSRITLLTKHVVTHSN